MARVVSGGWRGEGGGELTGGVARSLCGGRDLSGRGLGGWQVRYIIDYYHDASASVQDSAPKQHDLQSKVQINLDVRPALDSPMALWDRCRFGCTPYTPTTQLALWRGRLPGSPHPAILRKHLRP